VRKFNTYRLPFVLLFCGVAVCPLMPLILHAQETGDRIALRTDGGMAVVEPEVGRPASSREDHRPTTPLATANLGLKLVGTAVLENSGNSLAILYREDTGRQQTCREGSRLGQVLIKKILPDRVIIEAGRGEMILSMYHGRGIENVGTSPGMARLDQQEVATVLPDYLSLVKTIRIRPYFEAGKPGGIRVSNIDPDGLFGKMGLQDGDVIKGVNGKPLTVTLDAVEIYNRLKQGGRITLAVLRGEENVQLRFDVS
jgi:general secretion pathway protein C